MRTRIKYYILAFALSSANPPLALGQVNTLLNKIRAANNKSNTMSYDYKIVLRNMNTKKNVDSTSGRLYIKDGQYIDSNNYAFAARVGNYYCKLDHQEHTATICNMPDLAKKVGVRLANNEQKYMYNMTDSLLAKRGNRIIDSTNRHYYRVKTRLKNYPISYAQMEFRRDNYKLTEAYFETEDHSNNEFYLTKMQLTNIKDKVDDKIFDLSRIYTLYNSRPILNKKYSKYTLIPIEQ